MNARAKSERTALGRAFLQTSLLSEDLSHLASGTLGKSSTGNRDVPLLQAVISQPGTTPSDAAALLGMSRSATSRALAHLAGDGLLSRAPNPRDKRSARLFPTAAAQARVAAFEAALTGYLAENAGILRDLVADLTLIAAHHPVAEQSPASPADVIAEFARAGNGFAEDISEWAPGHGLQHRTDRAALSVVTQRGSVTPSDVAEALSMSSGGTTLLLDRLERNGLAARHRPEASADRRTVEVTCTHRGQEAMERLLDQFAEHAPQFCAVFSRAAGTLSATTGTAWLAPAATVATP